MVTAGSDVKTFGRNLSGAGTASRADMDKIGKSALVMAGVIGAGLGLSAKAAIDWESAWAGVTKTVDGSAAELAELESGLRDMSKVLPASHAEIAGVAEAAGQLGIKVGDVESFTKVMIDLGETTNLTAQDAATSLARISNIMGTASSDVERMGSTIVELGNNSATTEAEIVEFSTRLAAAGKIAGLSEADVFAFGSTLTSVGVGAEAGGTALSKVFMSIRDAVLDGGDNLETFARVAGKTTQEFAAAFRDDPAMAIESFITGLGRMNTAGESTTSVFEDLKLTDQRLMRALLSTAGAGTLLAEQIEMANGAWEDNNALQTEAEKRYATTAAKLEMAKNQVVDLAIDVGGLLLPALTGAADAASTMIRGFSSMPDGVKAASVGIAGVSAGLLTMIGGAAILVPKIRALRTALLTMGAAGRVASAAMPWLLAAAAAVATVSYVFGQNAQKAEEAEERVKGWTDAIRDVGSVVGGAEARLRDLATENDNLADRIDASGLSLEEWAKGLGGSQSDFDAFIAALREAEANGADFGVSIDLLTAGILPAMREEILAGADQAEVLGRVLGGTGDAAETTAPQIGTLTEALGLNTEEAEEARKAFEDLLDAYRGAVDPLFGMLDALKSNREAMAAEGEARAEGLIAIKEAADDLTEAENDLREARNKPDNADGIAAAEKRATEARKRLTDVQEDAVLTAEELADINQDVAESALDVEVAARELAAVIREQPGLLDEAVGMLEEWTEQGLITEGQAAAMAEQFGIAAGKADEFAGEYVASVYLVGADEVLEFIAALRAAFATDLELAIQTGVRAEGTLFAAGGLVPQYLAVGGSPFRQVGSDSIPAMLTPGEFVVNKDAVGSLGLGAMQSLNRGVLPMPQTTSPAGGGGRSGMDFRDIVVQYPKPEPAGEGVLRAARKAAALLG